MRFKDVWLCERPFISPAFYGTYPHGFLSKALALFPNAKDILHCPSGSLTGPGVTMDAVRDELRCPQVVGDAAHLPFADNSFDLMMSDPPYKDKDSKKYGMPPFPLHEMMLEAHRVVRPGGYFALLHLWCPSYNYNHWDLDGWVTVITGQQQYVRLFSIFKSKKGGGVRCGSVKHLL